MSVLFLLLSIQKSKRIQPPTKHLYRTQYGTSPPSEKQTKRTQIIQSFHELTKNVMLLSTVILSIRKQETSIFNRIKNRLVLHFFFPLYIMPCTVNLNGNYATSFIISQYFKDAEIHYNFCAVSRSAHLTSLIISLLRNSFCV